MPHFADITPDVSLLTKVGQSGHSVAEAVAELVDNAIDARIGRRTVKVDIEYDARDGWIEVSDNGRGMGRKELADALVLGLSTKADSEIGRFGLGLKTACTSLGTRFQINSAPVSGKVEWVADYDEEEFLDSGEWVLPIRRQARTRKSGTAIFIYSSRIYHGLNQSLARTLGSTFRHFIDDGILVLTLNGDPVEAVHMDIDDTSVLPVGGAVAGKAVRGWVGLLRVSSQRGWYGFSLVRNRRVIRRHEKLGFRPHPSTARVVGELHLDEFRVNNLKTDFIRETDDWRQLEKWISDTIEPVLAASRALAHAGAIDGNIKAAISQERERILASLGPVDHLPAVLSGGGSERVSEPVKVVLGTTHMTHQFEAAGAQAPHFRMQFVARPDDADLIAVFTNADHTAMTHQDASYFACHSLADAGALTLGERSEFISLKGYLLGVLLEQRPVRKALRSSIKGFLRTRSE